jgi:TRAP-type C4-dicarboxylate transport system permease small subunit
METFLKARRSPVLRLVFTLQRGISYSLLAAVIVLVLIQVYTRYVLNQPFTWTEEIARFSMVWFTFMSASYVMAERRHIRVVFFARLLGRVGTHFVNWFAQAVVIFVGVIMTYGSYLAQNASQIAGTASGVPISAVYIGALTGYALMVLHAIIESIDIIRGRDIGVSEVDLTGVTDA